MSKMVQAHWCIHAILLRAAYFFQPSAQIRFESVVFS
jgi:hypothetical protein